MGISIGITSVGSQGSSGSSGISGVQGIQGVQGILGAQGNQGSQGRQGFQGAQGRQGFQGPAAGPLAGYVGWWDASDTSTLTLTVLTVNSWADKSVNGYTLTQASGGMTSGTTLNGLNTVVSAGSDTYSSTLTASPTARTMCIVCKPTSTATYKGIIGSSSNGGLAFRLNQTTNYLDLGKQATAGIGTSTSGPANNAACVLVACYTAATSYAFYLNGTDVGNGTHAVTCSGGTVKVPIEDAGGFIGQIGEIVIYNSILSTGNRQSVEAYLKAKWATP